MTEILITVILLLLIATAWLYNRLVRKRNLVSQRSAPHVDL